MKNICWVWSAPRLWDRWALVLLALSLLAGTQVQAQRMVFAHYMLTNQDYQGNTSQEAKIAAYEREIKEARALGIDGFALNAGGWLQQPSYIEYAAQMFEAAARLNDGFKLMFSADMCCGNGMSDVEDMMRRFANNPRYAHVYFRYQGKFVLTTFAGEKQGVPFWQQVRVDLATGQHPSTATDAKALPQVSGAPSNAPLQIFLVPALFWGGELPRVAAVQQGFNTWKGAIDGSFYWGIAGVPGSQGTLDQLPSSEAYASVVHEANKVYMAPVALQFWGANANRYYEYSGGAGMRHMWMNAIEKTHPEWVEIITWNDFIEGTYISPIDDPNRYANANFLTASGVPTNTRDYFHSHAAAGELMRFYIEWYKTGKQPAITHDSVYWFYRTQTAGSHATAPKVEHKYGPVSDVIYVTANLTAPAELHVQCGKHESEVHLAAGSSDTAVLFTAGSAPQFRLMRGGKLVVAGVGKDGIAASPPFNDYYYSTGMMGR
ncbi:MAG TPA: endo-1,3-alpha-glucanase family glycosylhydrolase [Acidobacteriaceae bacterium]|nr:endo-1,3-alpha-glucanase family glycosylhydrolase [Acidobacteriaceae bacterium]